MISEVVEKMLLESKAVMALRLAFSRMIVSITLKRSVAERFADDSIFELVRPSEVKAKERDSQVRGNSGSEILLQTCFDKIRSKSSDSIKLFRKWETRLLVCVVAVVGALVSDPAGPACDATSKYRPSGWNIVSSFS